MEGNLLLRKFLLPHEFGDIYFTFCGNWDSTKLFAEWITEWLPNIYGKAQRVLVIFPNSQSYNLSYVFRSKLRVLFDINASILIFVLDSSYSAHWLNSDTCRCLFADLLFSWSLLPSVYLILWISNLFTSDAFQISLVPYESLGRTRI